MLAAYASAFSREDPLSGLVIGDRPEPEPADDEPRERILARERGGVGGEHRGRDASASRPMMVRGSTAWVESSPK
jgi:hypothetical protein